MTENETQYPVLVYGTLRPGEGNYEYFLSGQTVAERDVRLDGFVMHGQSGFPYMVHGDRTVTATLVEIDSENYYRVLRGLDQLEGFRGEGNPTNHYERILHSFELDGETVQAWMYVAENPWSVRNATSMPAVESGDWVMHKNAQRLEQALDSYTTWVSPFRGISINA